MQSEEHKCDVCGNRVNVVSHQQYKEPLCVPSYWLQVRVLVAGEDSVTPKTFEVCIACRTVEPWRTLEQQIT